MKFLLIRHAQSFNNVRRSDLDTYSKLRECDPIITDDGVSQAAKLGKYLDMEQITIDKMITSPLYRSLLTAHHITKNMKTSPPIEINTNIYEYGGCHKDGIGFPGKNRTFIKENFPSYNIPEDVTEEGWFTKEKKETMEECKKRALDVIKEFQQLARENEGKDLCYAFITHGAFLNVLLQAVLRMKIHVQSHNLLYSISNTGMCLLEINKEDLNNVKLVFTNLLEHLEDARLN